MEENSHPRKCKDGGIGSSMGFLPPLEDLIPLTQSLISPELASAFGIPPPHTPTTPTSTFTHTHTPTPNRSTNRRREEESSPATTTTRLEPLKLFPENHIPEIPRTRIDPVDSGSTPVSGCGGFDEESNSVSGGDENGLSSSTGRGGVKRPRLVWTPQLHKRFVDVIEHLGVEKAVPKTIMEMMNVEGLTRENVASHLQKYRLYLKRVERVASPAAADLSLGSNSRRGGGSSSNQMGGLYDCFGVVGNGYGGGQQIQPPVPSLQCNSLSLMPIQIPPAAPAGSPFLAEVGVRRIGYGGGSGSQLGLGVGIGIGGGSGGGGGGVSPQAGYCGLESGGFGTVFWNRQRG